MMDRAAREGQDVVTRLLDRNLPKGSVVFADVIIASFVAVLIGDALDAYSIGSVPVQWLARGGLITVALLVGFKRRLRFVPGTPAFLLFLCWAVVVTVINLFLNSDTVSMAPFSTTSLVPFVLLRLVVLVGFLSGIYLVYWLLVAGHRDRVTKWIVVVGTLASLVAIYIYLAQVYGLPEPLRSRMGTSGSEQATEFTYAFHRAMGTFREPSLFAAWLVVPFFLSFVHARSALNIHSLVIGVALILTGSLTGILGLILGLIGATLILGPLRSIRLRLFRNMVLTTALAGLIFSAVAVSYGGGRPSLVNVIVDRIAPIVTQGGMTQTNRAHVYAYLGDAGVPLLGFGLGIPNVMLGRELGLETLASFLSLYLNVLFSTGYIGLALLCIVLIGPVIRVFARPVVHRRARVLPILAAYLSWLVMFAVQSEEFQLMFAVIFGFLVFETRRDHVGDVESL